MSDLVLDTAEGKMYWTDPGARIASKSSGQWGGNGIPADCDGGGESPTFGDCRGGGTAGGISSLSFGKIQRANLDGTGVEDLVASGSGIYAYRPYGIVLDSAAGRMYWTSSYTRADFFDECPPPPTTPAPTEPCLNCTTPLKIFSKIR